MKDSESGGDPVPAPALSTEGRLIYAVGDVHGNLELLEALVLEITRDALASAPEVRPMLIFVGDYLDRGPASAGVIDLILTLRKSSVFELRLLKGNHEEAMLTFLVDPLFGRTWSQFGGGETLRSYGVAPPTDEADPDAWKAAQQSLLAVLPPEHLELLNALELLIVVGDYAFAHAGIYPHAGLDAQVERDLLWIRGEFLTSGLEHGKVVVHGHSPTAEPEILPNRLGIDTGVYASGALTAVRLHDGSQRIIQVRADQPFPGVAA